MIYDLTKTVVKKCNLDVWLLGTECYALHLSTCLRKRWLLNITRFSNDPLSLWWFLYNYNYRIIIAFWSVIIIELFFSFFSENKSQSFRAGRAWLKKYFIAEIFKLSTLCRLYNSSIWKTRVDVSLNFLHGFQLYFHCQIEKHLLKQFDSTLSSNNWTNFRKTYWEIRILDGLLQ